MSITVDTSLTSDYTIREAVADDAIAVFSLLQQLAETYAPNRAAFSESFDEFVSGSTDASIVVAVDASGSIRGYALTTVNRLLHTNGSSAQLQELVVDSELRGSGLGSALVEHVERVCRERGVKQLTVASRRSAGFYERMGYRSTADFLKRTFED
jgi:N-acetylglutamate synthase-like GNAT family acetyltransferase